MLGDIAPMMDALVALEETVHEDLIVKRWRPTTIDPPMLWNFVDDSPYEHRDQSRVRDELRLITSIGIRHSDVSEEMAAVETYADAFRRTIDPALDTNQPLGGTCFSATRTRMRLALDRFGGVDVLCAEFHLTIWLDRHI